ncbi:MAG: peptidylprolyl isomerase [Patescibacteria group bacterium]
MKKLLILSVSILFLAGCGSQVAVTPTPGGVAGIMDSPPLESQALDQPQTNNQTPNMPEMIIDQNKSYTAILHTDAGDMEVVLNTKDTPITANNFVSLAKSNFYNNTVFHRVIKGFMVQGGDPKGDGTGGPGYRFNDEPFAGEYVRGTVAMANAGPNTNGSQFFIMHADYSLPKNYVIFGKVVKGLDVLDKIAGASVVASEMGEISKPVTPVIVNAVEIIEE